MKAKMKKFFSRNKIKIIAVLVFFLGSVLWFFNKTAAQIISVCSLGLIAWILIKHLEEAGFRQILLLAAPALMWLLGIMKDYSVSSKICGIFNSVISFFNNHTGATIPAIDNLQSLRILFWLLFVVLYFITGCRDQSAAGKAGGKKVQEFREKSYKERCNEFRESLRRSIDKINSDSDWSEATFTPLKASVETTTNGKTKRAYKDLLKCLKKTKKKDTIYRVLGDPGSGKSVTLRKLCGELLDESESTNKIPLYVNLKKWVDSGNAKQQDLIQFIKRTILEDDNFRTRSFIEEYFEKMLENRRWFFIFDSFDEIPCLMGNRDTADTIDHLSELLFNFLRENKTGGIIASRFYKAPSREFKATVNVEIQPFDDIKIKTMAKQYLPNSKRFNEELFGNREDLVALCRNPFYLSLLLQYYYENEMSLPENQMELYQGFIAKRLAKCDSKIRGANISLDALLDLTRELAKTMQESSEYGLECPIDKLDLKKQDAWRKVIGILGFAKICRAGKDNESVSFVHRRFQEFFYTDYLMSNGKELQQTDYRSSILNNTGIRDSLVLYCEVVNIEKAKEIAEFCWNCVQKNIESRRSIWFEGGRELLNTLYFMSDAFRNRPDAIAAFLPAFEKTILENLDSETDHLIALAMTNSMILFDQEHLQNTAVKVLELNKDSLSHVVLQNLRMIKRINKKFELKLYRFFMRQNSHDYYSQFRNIDFSFSCSSSYRPLRILHLKRLFCTTMLFILVFLSSLISIYIFVAKPTLMTDLLKASDDTRTLFSMNPYAGFVFGCISFIYGAIITVVADMVILRLKSSNLRFPYLHDEEVGLSITLLSVSLITFFIFFCKLERISPFQNPIYMLIVPLVWIIIKSVIESACLIYLNLYNVIQIRQRVSFIKESLPTLLMIIGTLAFLSVVFIFLNKYPKAASIFEVFLTSVIVISSLLSRIKDWYCYRKDIKQINEWLATGKLNRNILESHLAQLNSNKTKVKYLQELDDNNVELIGRWNDDIRPYAEDDELSIILAKLDTAHEEVQTRY